MKVLLIILLIVAAGLVAYFAQFAPKKCFTCGTKTVKKRKDGVIWCEKCGKSKRKNGPIVHFCVPCGREKSKEAKLVNGILQITYHCPRCDANNEKTSLR